MLQADLVDTSTSTSGLRVYGYRWMRSRGARLSVDVVLKSALQRAVAVRDVVVALALCAAGEFELASGATYGGHPVWPGPVLANALIIPVLTLPMIARRRRPLASVLFTLGGITVCAVVLGGGEATTEFLLLIATVFSGAAYSEYPAVVAVAALVTGTVHGIRDPAVHSVGDGAWTLGMLAIAFLLGRALHGRQRRISSLQLEAVEREKEHVSQVAAATAAERAAIARELHDIVAHAVSVVVIQSQAGARALPQRPDVAAQTLVTIEETGRTALNDLRRLLTVLSPAAGDPDSRPLGSLGQLDELIRTFQASGLRIELDRPARLPRLAPAAELAAYRVV
jgi:signal transduction histidine kinase